MQRKADLMLKKLVATIFIIYANTIFKISFRITFVEQEREDSIYCREARIIIEITPYLILILWDLI